MMKRAIVLGCGPSGLIAAEGLERQGWGVSVLSRGERSVISGAQYLHAPIPGITTEEPEGYLRYLKIGTAAGYAEKVYGDPSAPCSWDLFEATTFPAWSMQYAYENLWREWQSRIIPREIDCNMIHGLLWDYELVVSTVPAWLICKNPSHSFNRQNIWISPSSLAPQQTIIYNGDPTELYYRTSRIFDYSSTEYSRPMFGAHRGMKPTGNDCNCYPNVRRMGRFGKWEKGVLVHHVWEEINNEVFAVR